MDQKILAKLLSFPQREHIQIDFNAKEKVFSFSAPIYTSPLPPSIKNYVEARKNHTFRPFKTSFVLKQNQVYIQQQVPFSFGEPLRRQVHTFWQVSRRCHQMLHEIAAEEKYQEAIAYRSSLEGEGFSPP